MLSLGRSDMATAIVCPQLNTINSSLLEPIQEYRLAETLAVLPLEDSPQFLEVTEQRVYQVLGKFNPWKACGPDAIPNWLLKEYAKCLKYPLTMILNTSFKE